MHVYVPVCARVFIHTHLTNLNIPHMLFNFLRNVFNKNLRTFGEINRKT